MKKYQAYWGVEQGNDEYGWVILATVPLREVVTQAPRPQPGVADASAIAFQTYGRDSIWATDHSFISVAVLSDLVEHHSAVSVTLRDGFGRAHTLQLTKAAAEDIRRLARAPEGTVLIHRLLSPLSCRDDLAFLRSIAPHVTD